MILQPSEKKRLLQRYGTSALVTGASSGIGRELAEKLASAGFNLIIVARNEERLKHVKNEIQTKYNVDITIKALDLSIENSNNILIEQTKDIDIGLIVLSAGYGSSGLFTNASIHDEINMLQVNCTSLLILTHYFAQRFIEKRKGGIILMSSMVAFQGVPFAAHYAATKAYVQSLAEALSEELKPFQVDVLSAAPGPVESGFGTRAKMTIENVLKPSDIGVPILKALGRQTTVLPGWLTKILVYSLRTVPRWGKIRIMKQVMAGMAKG